MIVAAHAVPSSTHWGTSNRERMSSVEGAIEWDFSKPE